MDSSARNWTLVLIEHGARGRSWQLKEGRNPVGRDSSNVIRLLDSSVSRQHAEILCGPDGVFVCDLKSRNGVMVNDVPRKKAALQPGDRVKIGIFELEFGAGQPTGATTVAMDQGPDRGTRAEQTIEQSLGLPEGERELFTLYHVCFWLTEGMEEKDFIPKCLRLLADTFRADEAHLYGADGRLQAFASPQASKPAIKLGDFLAKRFQSSPEAVIIEGVSIAKHQLRVGQFNYLVSPLRADQANPAPIPFVVMVRPAAQLEFTNRDRVLLQAVCRLWVRGQARAVQVQDLRRENTRLKQKVGTPILLGNSAVIEKLREQALKAAAGTATVLIVGETGSGKEVVANLVHESSPRREASFIKVNCGAIPEGLIESELFGHVRGAFTGAVADRKGKFALADQGTLFLDEIGELPLPAQAKLLRAIENGEIEPVGSESVKHVNVRVLAATNRDLKEMVRQKQFREDLLFRLDVVRLMPPPLREHLEDVAPLAELFLARICAEGGPELTFAPEGLAELQRHSWPGNVRELSNVVRRCAHLAGAPIIDRPVVRQAIDAGL